MLDISFRTSFLQRAAIAALLSPAVLAQSPAAAPAFEVAVIKPSRPIAEALPLLMQGKLRVGISIDKARVDMEFVTLTDLIVAAWKIKPHQISGPDWLSMERFDIQAKLPDGAAEDRVPEMLRALLAERFGLNAHAEQRTISAYALIVGKNGAKLPLSTLPPNPEPDGRIDYVDPFRGRFHDGFHGTGRTNQDRYGTERSAVGHAEGESLRFGGYADLHFR